ncbi:uncharacterized protein BDZ99DRAFT_520885 [Mytilinidion resinicola]|uniref:Uncharacterized protein n=1 Tax=Mytilinidion resinicola TaxID=574789 RepID=A0A6A6YNI2_9PEZI|nr:uncharacterized protein BDZ99DRAFT_520885 [Mytilinidion resinicola]KAF2809535.1 hypothetical protein BDZ99DRAFT_520885 [Mytilinidion resinicola]
MSNHCDDPHWKGENGKSEDWFDEGGRMKIVSRSRPNSSILAYEPDEVWSTIIPFKDCVIDEPPTDEELKHLNPAPSVRLDKPEVPASIVFLNGLPKDTKQVARLLHQLTIPQCRPFYLNILKKRKGIKSKGKEIVRKHQRFIKMAFDHCTASKNPNL